jgi:tRNA(adenine34) deaminase
MTRHKIRMAKLIKFTKNSDSEPYGCAIYDENNQKIVEVIGNKASPINHAEILAINECARMFPNIKWDTLTLYTTGEPCCMCAAACCWANVKEVVYATDVLFMIKLWNLESQIRAIDIIKSYPKKPNLISNICQNESNKMFLEYKDKFAKTWNEKRWLLQAE